MGTVSFEQSELWEISRRLIGFNTVSSLSNMEAVSYIANYLDGIGFEVQILREQVEGVEKGTVIAWAGPDRDDGLILSGHTDIVPFEGQPGWNSDPLQLLQRDDRWYGRGVSDMKIFLVQAMLAAKRVQLNKLKRPLMFIFTCDEEVAGQGSGRLIHILQQHMGTHPLPKVAVIGEPTNFAIYSAHKGYAAFDVTVHGKGGHSSAPHKGVNAIQVMAEVVTRLTAANERLRQSVSPENRQLFPEYPATVFNCGTIQGGLAPNMIADTCNLSVSMRIAPGDNVDNLLAEVQQCIDTEIVRVIPECNVKFENMIMVPPLAAPPDHPFCDTLCRVMERPMDSGAPYATDGGYFQMIGIDSYICGPGLLEEAHQPNESIPVVNVIEGMKRLERLVQICCIE